MKHIKFLGDTYEELDCLKYKDLLDLLATMGRLTGNSPNLYFMGLNEEIAMFRIGVSDYLIGIQYSLGLKFDIGSVPTLAYIYRRAYERR